MTSSATTAGRIRLALGAALVFGLLCIGFAMRVSRTVGAEISSDASAAAHRLDELMIYLVVGGVVCAFAIALTASHLVVSPLEDVTRAVNAMRRDLGIRSGVRGDDEIGQLGEALDRLAEWLANERSSLEDNRDRLAAILESMAEGVMVTGGAKGTIVLANAALREMLLLDRSILGRPPLEAVRVSGLDDILRRAEESGEGAAGEIELTRLRPRRMLVRATPLIPKGEHPGKGSHGLVVVFNDVTELRRLETMRRDFVANVSHELRTPIASIRAASDTLLGGALSDPAAAQEFTAIIGRSATRLLNLVEDLLELSRIEARQWTLEIDRVDLREVVAAAFEVVENAARDRGTTLTSEIAEASAIAAADRRALEQIVVNLVDNAVKYAGPRATVRVTATTQGERTLVQVRDDGPGIEPRHLPRLFERFYRVDAGRSRAVGGTGLGLSIVKHLVEAMGATIAVDSVVGVGTTFTIGLRRAKNAEEASASAPIGG